MEAKLPGADAEYESLVREQLTQLGYNSDAIPDEVCSLRILVRLTRATPTPAHSTLRTPAQHSLANVVW